MTRPVLLLTLGADALPNTTPVIAVPATWVPAIYVPPPVPVPGGVLASAIADAVLITWTAVNALAAEYEVERAADNAGVPDAAWARLAKTMDLRTIAAAPDGLAYWFRLRTESLGRLSAYTAPVVGVPIASNPAVVPLAIVGGVVTGATVTAGGTGYTSAPLVAFTGGGGSGATATATIASGVVTGITITAAGNGYTSAPTVSFSGGAGTGAAATAATSGSSVTINCAYQQFKLVLNANVTSVVFVNVPAATTILIEIEQTGAFTVAWPASVVPLSGAPYVVSATAGAVDLVGLTSNNAGVTWRLTAQQPVPATAGGSAGAPTVTIAPSPASATVATDGVTATAPSVQVTATAAGGTAPITGTWTRADTTGGADFIISNAASATAIFSIPAATTAYSATQQWRYTVNDAAALTAQALVDITLARTAPVAAAVTIAPSPASGLKMTPFGTTATVSAAVTASRAGMVGPFTQSWAQLSGDAGISAVYTSSTDTCTFQASASQNTVWTGVFRHTTTDTGNANATYTADVTVNLEIVDDR